MLATPTTKIEKIKGITSIFNKERKIVPIGFIHNIQGEMKFWLLREF